jgi:hypothetical protein
MGQVQTHNLRSMLCLVLEATDSMYTLYTHRTIVCDLTVNSTFIIYYCISLSVNTLLPSSFLRAQNYSIPNVLPFADIDLLL